MYNLIRGDCLTEMQNIPDGSVDMILCDPPYGTTACKWDTVIPFEPMWEQLNRIIKSNGAICLFGTQPFTSFLICSNIDMFKYLWTWDKCRVGGFTSAKLKPLKLFEDICVFSKGKTANCNKNNMVYYPQGLVKVDKVSRSSNDHSETGYARPSQKEKYIQDLEKKVEEMPKTLLSEYEKGSKDTKLELEKEYKYSTELLKKDFQSIIDRQTDKIESLNEELRKITEQNISLQEKVDKAYIEIKELASKTVETTGAVKIIGNSSQEINR